MRIFTIMSCLVLTSLSSSVSARDYYRFADGELLMTGKGITRAEVTSLVKQQRRVKKLGKDRYLLDGAVRGKYIVEFIYKKKKLTEIRSQQAK